MMSTTLSCNPTRVLYNAPVAGTRTAGEPSTSSISRLHLRGRWANKNLSLKLAGRQGTNQGIFLVRASLGNEGDGVREIASEKAVESGREVSQDEEKLANGQSPVVLDAKVEDASDAASYEADVREGVVDIASDTAVDSSDDVDALAKKDAAPLSGTYGRSVEDTAEALESKAAEVGDREAITESDETQVKSGAFFEDQVVKDERLSRSGSIRQISDQFEGLKRTFSKNLKEGIDSNRPGLEKLSRNASQSVKAGREYLNDAGEGAADFSGDAQTVLEDAKGALDKRQSAVSLAVEDARETGTMVAELASKGWDALIKTTGNLVGKFQRNAGDFQVKAQEKAEEVKQRAEVVAEQAQSKFAEVKQSAEEASDQAQKQFAEAKQNAEEAADRAQKQFAEAQASLQAKTDELRDAAQEKASESRSNLEKAVNDAQLKFNEARDDFEARTRDLKDVTEKKTSESSFKLEEATDEAESKLSDAKENVQTKTGELKDAAEEKTSEAKSKL